MNSFLPHNSGNHNTRVSNRGLNNKVVDRLERILTMVYVVQNYLASFGLCPSSGTSTYQTMDRVQKKSNSSVQQSCCL
jgi:hypothetical protein